MRIQAVILAVVATGCLGGDHDSDARVSFSIRVVDAAGAAFGGAAVDCRGYTGPMDEYVGTIERIEPGVYTCAIDQDAREIEISVEAGATEARREAISPDGEEVLVPIWHRRLNVADTRWARPSMSTLSRRDRPPCSKGNSVFSTPIAAMPTRRCSPRDWGKSGIR